MEFSKKVSLQVVLLISLLTGMVFVWQTISLPCETPLQYSLGVFDERFGLSREDFLKEVADAEQLWEGTLGRELFTYTPDAPFKVNLIFDERQEQTIEGKKLEASFERTQKKQETLAQKQQTILALYEAKSREYERLVSSFKRRLDAYNADVEKWNRAGGAPEDVYKELAQVSEALSRESKSIETKREVLNQLVTEVNAFSKQKVAVVEQYNSQVEQYVNRYGESGEFDQGDYVGTEINIYQYDDLAHLRLVLVHELGHALGLVHGTNPTSVMYHLMEEQPLSPVVLSVEDRAMLIGQCEQGVFDILYKRMSPSERATVAR